MKRLLGIGLVAAMAMVGASTVQALSIGINLSSDASGSTVLSSLSDGYVAQVNWNNWNANSRSFVESTVKDSSGGTIVDLTVGLGIAWDDGYWADVVNDGGAVGTLARSGWGAQYGPLISLANIPYATYDVATLHSGYGGGDLQWSVETGLTGSSFTTPSYQNGGGYMQAIQIIDRTVVVDPPPVVPEPGTIVLLGSLLGLGAIGGLRKRFFGAKKSVVA